MNMKMDRRRFLRGSLGLPPLIAALFAASVTISCDESSDESQTDAPAMDEGSGGTGGGDLAGAISDNHGHTCVITQVDLDARNAVTLTLTLGSGHTHTLELTATQVQDIALGTQVTQTSSLTGHTHDVTFN